MPHWCKKPSPVVTSRTNNTTTANMAALPFHVSALLVQPHSHIVTGGGRLLRWESYVASNSSTLLRGTRDCQKQQKTTLRYIKAIPKKHQKKNKTDMKHILYQTSKCHDVDYFPIITVVELIK